MSNDPPNDQPAADALTDLLVSQLDHARTRESLRAAEADYVWMRNAREDALQRAEAAEQRVTDVEQERDKLVQTLAGSYAVGGSREAAEATIASLRTLQARWRAKAFLYRAGKSVVDMSIETLILKICTDELEAALAEGPAVPPASSKDEDSTRVDGSPSIETARATASKERR